METREICHPIKCYGYHTIMTLDELEYLQIKPEVAKKALEIHCKQKCVNIGQCQITSALLDENQTASDVKKSVQSDVWILSNPQKP